MSRLLGLAAALICWFAIVAVGDAGSSKLVQKLPSATTTTIHNAEHAVVTTIEVGTTVHDFVTVTGQVGGPVPGGNVNIDYFLSSGACPASPSVNSGSIGPLNASGQLDATGFAFTVNSAGTRAFRAHYEGDGNYDPSDGSCESLTVVDANIQLTPSTDTNRVGTNHLLTCHINVNDGTGYANAPADTVCTGSVVTGPGAFVGSNQCQTVLATGSCELTFFSNVTGTTTIRASTDVSVGGVSVHRQTGDTHVGDSSDAQKLWVNAAIVIAPNATNPVGQPHTFTATLLFDTGFGLIPAGAGQPVTITLTNSGGAVATPPGPFNLTTNAASQVSVTFTSATAGQVFGHASWTGSVSGSPPFTVQTDGVAPNSNDAVKTFTGSVAVQMAWFRAAHRHAGVLVRWRMGTEVGVLGYNVYRQRKGARIRLNRAIIPARGGVAGRSYSYLDRSAPRNIPGLRYWLQIVNTDGSRVWKVTRAH